MLKWQVHFRGYPASELLPWTGSESLRASYLNSLKARLCIIVHNI